MSEFTSFINFYQDFKKNEPRQSLCTLQTWEQLLEGTKDLSLIREKTCKRFESFLDLIVYEQITLNWGIIANLLLLSGVWNVSIFFQFKVVTRAQATLFKWYRHKASSALQCLRMRYFPTQNKINVSTINRCDKVYRERKLILFITVIKITGTKYSFPRTQPHLYSELSNRNPPVEFHCEDSGSICLKMIWEIAGFSRLSISFL